MQSLRDCNDLVPRPSTLLIYFILFLTLIYKADHHGHAELV